MIARTLFFLLALPVLLPADEQPVRLDGGNTIQLCGGCASRQIRVAVSAHKLALKKGEDPQVIEVSMNGVREKAWTDWFHPRWDPTQGDPASLLIEVSNDLEKAGTYNLVLLIRPGLPKLVLQVVQPAAQLELPEKLLISRTQFLPWSCCDPDAFSFDVRETSGAVSVTNLELFNRPATQGTEDVSGTLALQDRRDVPAGQAVPLALQLRGDYPRGTVTGALKLIAPQLAQPVPLLYEVHTRLWSFYLLFAIIAGLALSYYVRTLLEDRIQLSQAQAQAQDILDEVDENARNYDDTVRNDIHAAWQALQQGLAGAVLDTINRQAGDLRTAWTEAVKAYNGRIVEATQETRELQTFLAIDWIVPAPCTDALAEARTGLATATSALQQRQADTAIAALLPAREQFAQTLHNAGRTWQNDARGLATTIADATLAIPEPVGVQFAAILQQAPPELNRIKDDPIPADAPSIRHALEDLQTELAGFANLLARLAAGLRVEWNTLALVWQAIPPANLPRRDLLQTLGVDFLALADQLHAAAPAPRPLLDQLPDRLANLQQQWHDAIVQQIPLGFAQLPRLEQEIASRDFRGATRAMSAIVQGAQAAWGAVPGANQQPGPPIPQAGQAVAANQQYSILNFTGGLPASVPSVSRVRIQATLRQAKLTQTAIVGALTALWAYTSYSQSWDGTWTGLLAPLLAAFLLDISVEGLKNQFSAKKV
jgi:uncharacterized membrane protein